MIFSDLSQLLSFHRLEGISANFAVVIAFKSTFWDDLTKHEILNILFQLELGLQDFQHRFGLNGFDSLVSQVLAQFHEIFQGFVIQFGPRPFYNDLFKMEFEIVFPKIEDVCDKIEEQNWNSKWYEKVDIHNFFLVSSEVRQATELIDDAYDPGKGYKHKGCD